MREEFGDDYLIINGAIFLSEIKTYLLRSCLWVWLCKKRSTYSTANTVMSVLVDPFGTKTKCIPLPLCRQVSAFLLYFWFLWSVTFSGKIAFVNDELNNFEIKAFQGCLGTPSESRSTNLSSAWRVTTTGPMFGTLMTSSISLTVALSTLYSSKECESQSSRFSTEICASWYRVSKNLVRL